MTAPHFEVIDSRLPPSSDVLLDSLAHPVLAVDHNGELTYANASAQVLLGGWIVGLRFTDVFPDHKEPLDRLAADGKPFLVTSKAHSRYRVFLGASNVAGRMLSLFPDDTDASSAIVDEDELTGLLKRNGLNARAGKRPCHSARCRAQRGDPLHRSRPVQDRQRHARPRDRRSAPQEGGGPDPLRLPQGGLRRPHRRRRVRRGAAGVADQQDAERLAARLVDLIGRTYVLGGHTVNIGASVGVALAEHEATAPRDLLRNGDLALYEAKRAGRGRFRVFETGMDAALRERRELEIDLRRALALRQFDVHYQPFVDLQADKVIGFEALIRWDHPSRGRVSPADFIPLAEETGLICKIGEWVLRTACATAMTWPDEMTVAVNVSPVQFKADALVDDGALGARPCRPAAAPAGDRDHRGRAARRHRERAQDAARPARSRREDLDGRFRHRLFVAQLPAEIPVQQDQDRPLLRAGRGRAAATARRS